MFTISPLRPQLLQRVQTLADQRAISVDELIAELLEQSLEAADYRAALMQSEARYRALLDSQLDLVCRYRHDMTLTFVNQAYYRFLGIQDKELIGKRILDYIPSSEVETFKQMVCQLQVDPAPQTIEFHMASAAHKDALVMWTAYGIRDATGVVVEIQAVGRDITERRQLEEQVSYAQELQNELTRERELINLKNEMISMLSHEFRTPLAVIQTSIEVLERYAGRLQPEQIAERYGVMQIQIKQMVTLMEDMLLYRRFDSAHMTVEKHPVDISGVCLRVCDELLLTDNNNHNLRAEIDPGIGMFNTDQRLLERICVNLIGNALKYSPEHSTVSMKLGYEGTALVLQVSDQGIGIPVADHAHLFEPFYRARNVGRTSGTGLGLSIVKQAVIHMGGTITFVSSETTGTTFTVKFYE